MRENWQGNPVLDFLNVHGLTPCQLAIAAGTDYNVPYMALNGYCRRLPHSIIEAVDQLDGEGEGDKLDRAYRVYRDGLSHDLLMKA